MSIVAADLICYGSLNRPEGDTAASGGGIDVENRPVFTQFSGNARLALISDGADTRDVNVKGRDTTGAKITETITLTGAVEVLSVATFERMLSVQAPTGSATRTVTAKQGSGGTTIGTIQVNEKGFYCVFIDSASEASATSRFEKTFWKNTHATLTLNAAKVRLSADPSAKIKTAVVAAKNDSTSVANRKTVPTGPTFVDDNVDQDVPATTLAAGEAIAVWWQEDLGINDAPVRSTFTARLAGTTV